MEENSKNQYINAEEDYFEEFDEEDWQMNSIPNSEAEANQWNNTWEENPNEELCKRIRVEIDKYKEKVAGINSNK